MSLAAEKGSVIHLKINGPDAKEAMQELEKIITGEPS
jgi:phosphotransferase system HPr (HPr) family protein